MSFDLASLVDLINSMQYCQHCALFAARKMYLDGSHLVLLLWIVGLSVFHFGPQKLYNGLMQDSRW